MNCPRATTTLRSHQFPESRAGNSLAFQAKISPALCRTSCLIERSSACTECEHKAFVYKPPHLLIPLERRIDFIDGWRNARK